MTKFAKLLESEKYGQILAILTDADGTNEPQIAIICHPGEPIGVCQTCLTYADNDDGLARRAAAFERMDIAMIEDAVKQIFIIAEEMRSNGATELTA